MSIQDNEDYKILSEAILEMAEEYKFVGHFIINPRDAEDSNFTMEMDDLTGEQYLDVEGYRVYLHEDCPPGQIGACVPETTVGLA